MKVHNLVVTGSLQSGGENITSISSSVASTVVNVSSSLSNALNQTSASLRNIMATTGSNVFVGTQTISGSIVPAVNGTYDLGSSTHEFRHLYLSSASLYIDGTKVLGSTTQELQITTDNGQSFKILEAGSDTITLQAADGNITLATSGGGDVILDPTSGIIALKGTTTLYAGNRLLSSDGNAIQIGNSTTITGSLIVTGYIEAQELRTTYISSSILYRSGSTKFGDELTDTHAFTGSLLISGSVTAIGSNLISGSAQLPSGLVSGSSQISFTGTTGYSTYINQALLTTSNSTFNSVTSGDYRYTGTGYITYDVNNGGSESLIVRKYATTVLTLNSNGYLGINRETPTRRFDLYDGSPSGGILAKFESGNSSGWIQLKSTSSSWQMGANSSGYVIYNDGTAQDRLIIATTGEMGIGTAVLSHKLNVEGGAMFKSTGTAELTLVPTGGASSSSYIQAYDVSASTFKNLLFYGKDIIFRAQTGSTEYERVRINGANGCIGINVTTPDRGIDLNLDSSYASIQLRKAGNSMVYLGTGSSSSGSGNENGILQMYHSGTENIRLYTTGNSWINGGNFGVGTASPSGKFHVDHADTYHQGILNTLDSTFVTTTKFGRPSTSSYLAIKYDIEGTEIAYINRAYTTARLLFKRDTATDMEINGAGAVGINATPGTYPKLNVGGSLQTKRTIHSWYEATPPDGIQYWHMKTNMWGGGSPSGNVDYTMSLFKGYFYTYSAAVREGMVGFHNWSGSIYNTAANGNLFGTPYVSSDGYVVLVAIIGGGSYNSLTIDWYQAYEYPFRDKTVTAASGSSSSSGVY